VNSPAAPAARTRYVNRYYGTLEASGAWKIFSRESALDILRLVPRTGGLNFEWKSGDQSGTEVYRRVSDTPFLLEQAISSFDAADRPLLEAYETRPLLQSQIGLLRGIFADPDRIGKLLNDFYDPKCDPIQQWDEYCQGQATKAFGKVKKWLNDPARGYHVSDRALALLYTRHYLTYNRWRPSTKYPFLPALDWSQRAVSVVEYQSKHHPNRTGTTDASVLTGDLVDIMGLKTAADSDGHIHTYKVTMKLYGATALIGGMGGTLTVEKTDDKPWPKEIKSETFKIWFVSVGAGLKLKKGKGAKAVGPFKAGETYVGKASSNFYWLPQDFPSQIRVALGEAKAEAGVKVGAEGGFMHILGRGSLPMLEVIFSDTDVGVGGKTVGAGAEIIAGIGRIRDKTFKDVEYPVTPDKSDYAVVYHQSDDTYFGYNSALLKEGARKALRTMCAHELVALMSPESTLQIEGHTDVEGKDADNQVLSDLRASNTRLALEDILGTRLQCQVTAKGYGETEAAKAGETKRNQDRRRVDLKLNGRLVLRLRAN
jgi:outer membrane protein OmpA-like peptidoglycan-associated protein